VPQKAELTREAEQALAHRQLEAAVAIYNSEQKPREAYNIATTRKLVACLIGWRGLSVPQWDLLRRCLDEIALAEEFKHLDPCPSGRHTVKGKVITVHEKATPQGIVRKMMVRSERGYRVYCTVPKGLDGVERGAEVEFTCTLEPAGEDRMLGWGSNPSAARERV